MPSSPGLPTVRTLDHLGLTVPDVATARTFLVDVLGFEELYSYAPNDRTGEVQEQQFARHPDAVIDRIAMLRLGTLNLELFEFRSPDQRRVLPRSSDWGAAHLALYVDDLDAAVEHVGRHGAQLLGVPMDLGGPEAGPGNRFIFVLAPGGLTLELITYPQGKHYEQSTDRRLFDPRTQEPWSPGR